MNVKHVLVVLALALVASSALVAQPPIVNIHLNPGGKDADGKEKARVISVTPRVMVVCRNTANCPTQYDFQWLGTAGGSTERIQVKFLDGLYWDGATPKTVSAKTCFIFPGDDNPFKLEHGAPQGKPLVLWTSKLECPDKVVFFYEISCTGGTGGNCGGVKPLDPGALVDNGRR